MIKATVDLNGPASRYWADKIATTLQGLDQAKSYRVYISDRKPTRSRAQNKYLWGVVYKTISDYTGYDSHDLHEMFKTKFSLRTQFSFGGELQEYCKSTASMTTEEMTVYIDKLIRWGAEHDITIPEAKTIPDHVYITAILEGGR